MSDDKTAAYYDDFAGRYDAERRRGYFGFINEMEFETIRPLLPGRKTLEVGCGTGLILERAQAAGADAYGIDLSPEMVERAAAKGLKARAASATELPFEDRSFDVVYSFKVLPHVPEIGTALAEIARVTRPGGRMVLEFYNPLSWKGLADGLRGLVRRKPVFIRNDWPGDVRRMLPPNVRVLAVSGIRIFGMSAACYTIPVIGGATRRLDRLAARRLWRLGGYMVFEIAL